MNIKELHQATVAAATPDIVNTPPHYMQGGIECIEVLEALGLAEHYCHGNAIKYLWRLKEKGKPLEDARKARWYVDRLIGYLQDQEHKDV
jgi:hypothetical protein